MSKTGLRFHPYSQQESHHNKSNKENLNPVKPKSSNSNKKLIFETKKTNNSNYDYQYYLNGADSTKSELNILCTNFDTNSFLKKLIQFRSKRISYITHD